MHTMHTLVVVVCIIHVCVVLLLGEYAYTCPDLFTLRLVGTTLLGYGHTLCSWQRCKRYTHHTIQKFSDTSCMVDVLVLDWMIGLDRICPARSQSRLPEQASLLSTEQHAIATIILW